MPENLSNILNFSLLCISLLIAENLMKRLKKGFYLDVERLVLSLELLSEQNMHGNQAHRVRKFTFRIRCKDYWSLERFHANLSLLNVQKIECSKLIHARCMQSINLHTSIRLKWLQNLLALTTTFYNYQSGSGSDRLSMLSDRRYDEQVTPMDRFWPQYKWYFLSVMLEAQYTQRQVAIAFCIITLKTSYWMALVKK